MLIYHGGYCSIEKVKIIESEYTKDFGQGFYCTLFKTQALRWAKRHITPVLNIYNYVPDGKLKILSFEDMTEEWLEFIVNCRRGILHDNYIVIGAMANDQIYNYISDYVDGVLTKEQFWILAKFKYPTNQICFCTQKSLTCLNYIANE